MQTLLDSKFKLHHQTKTVNDLLIWWEERGIGGHYDVSICNLNFPTHFPQNVLHISTTFHHVLT